MRGRLAHRGMTSARPFALYPIRKPGGRMVASFRSLMMFGSFVVALALGGCDGLLGPDGQTRILLRQGVASGPSFSIAPTALGTSADQKSERTAVLALVDGL